LLSLVEGGSETEPVVGVDPWVDRCGRRCDGGYDDFLAGQARKRTPIGWLGLLRDLSRSKTFETQALGTVREDRLASRIRTALAMDDLLEGLEERTLLVAILDETRRSGLLERRLLFGDEVVGSFEALLLMPLEPASPPAVIGLHGHRDSARVFAAEFMGYELARRGLGVLIPDLRAHDCSLGESRIAFELLRHGSTLMGLKVYETLLMAKYLNSLEEVDSRFIGLLGHSGGSSIADLAVLVSDRFAAKVTDLRIEYDNRCGSLGVHCETVPALVSLSGAMKVVSPGTPSLEVPYGYPQPATRSRISEFFSSTLSETRPR
jgi:hypothetical protein